MAFKVILTEGGQRSRDHAVDYILNELENPFAAKRFYSDVMGEVMSLETMAMSYAVCEEESLAKRQIRKVHLKKYKYKIFYHIENENEVHIDMILHDKQDVTKWL